MRKWEIEFDIKVGDYFDSIIVVGKDLIQVNELSVLVDGVFISFNNILNIKEV